MLSSENTLCLFGMSVSRRFQTCPCVSCIVRRSQRCFVLSNCYGAHFSWIFSSHRRANTGLNHVVRVSNPMQNKIASSLWTFRTTEPSCDSECSRDHDVCPTANGLPARCCAPARHSRQRTAQTPLRFFKVATGSESSGDEFGVLEDDRCIDTGFVSVASPNFQASRISTCNASLHMLPL